MKTLLLLPIIIIGASINSYARNLNDVKKNYQNPIANAGPDKTVYLTQGSEALLDGSASVGDFYQWTEVSTDYMSGAIISSPTSKITSVTGLPQGVFYFKLTASSGELTSEDSMKVIVDYDLPPRNSKIAWLFPIQEKAFANLVNLRDDTIHHFGYNEGYNDYAHSRYYKNGKQYLFLERSRLNSMMVDSLKGKFRTTLEDGYGWGNNSNVEGASYARSQINIVNNADFFIDSSKTFVFIWKIYFPQSVKDNMLSDPDWGRVTMWDIHGNDDEGGQFGITLSRDFLLASDRSGEIEKTGSATETKLINTADLYNKTHTIRIYYREGSASTRKAFIRVEVDGVVKYSKTSGKVGKTLMQDYVKATGLYDYRRLLANPDNKGSGKKFSLVTMDADIYAVNSKPTVNAGIDQTTTSSTVTLSGSATDEGVSGNGYITSYQWTKISGAGGTLTSPNAANTRITGLTTGIYLFELKAVDDSGISATDTVQITVNAGANQAPIANAGSDKSITLPTNSISLSGSGSDKDGTISSYLWTKVSGPSTYKIVNPSSPITDVTGLVQGIYRFEFEVTDNEGATATSTVQITVNAAANQAPTANAGSDKSITLPTNSTSLFGSGSDKDGTISSYLWTKISGPAAYRIVNSSAAVANVTGLVQGVYRFELKVTDNNGATATSTVQVTVNAAANQTPTANAGSDKSITLPINFTSLSGSGSDKDGNISSYLWTKISGPASYKIVNPSSPITDVIGLVQGVYQFELKVIDNKGGIGKDTVQVSVNKSLITNTNLNINPVANAGNDTTVVSPVDYIILNGRGIDSDGSIVGYLWTQISGPSQSTILSGEKAVARAENLKEGTYEFELTVTDNNGAKGKDTVKVTVALGRFATGANTLKIYPSPVYTVAPLEITSTKPNAILMIVVTDIFGKNIYKKKLVASLSTVKENIDMSNWAAGTYVVTAFFDNMEKQSVKVIKM